MRKRDPLWQWKLGLGSAEKALGVSVGSRLNRSQRPPLAAEEVDSITGCCGEGILSLCSAFVSPHPDTASGFEAPPTPPQYKTGIDKLVQVQQRGSKMTGGLEHLPSEVRQGTGAVFLSYPIPAGPRGKPQSEIQL